MLITFWAKDPHKPVSKLNSMRKKKPTRKETLSQSYQEVQELEKVQERLRQIFNIFSIIMTKICTILKISHANANITIIPVNKAHREIKASLTKQRLWILMSLKAKSKLLKFKEKEDCFQTNLYLNRMLCMWNARKRMNSGALEKH